MPHIAALAANALVSALLAPSCAVCGALLDTPIDGCVCRNCWASIRFTPFPLCHARGEPLVAPPLIRQSRAIGEYDGALREIIQALKYQRRHSIAAGLAHLMRVRGRAVLADADCVVPVPLHPRRERARGFNQARELARHLGVSVAEPLIRVRHTPPQVALGAESRAENVRGAFRAQPRPFTRIAGVRGLCVVLIDDVKTTGATLEECAAVLKSAGAGEVRALTAAVVTGRPREA